jgi:hypothetical protein
MCLFSHARYPALQEHFVPSGKQLPGCGFPIAHLLALFHAGTGMVLHLLAAPLRTQDLSEVIRFHPELCSGEPAEAPARLVLALVMQFAEGLSDRQVE